MSQGRQQVRLVIVMAGKEIEFKKEQRIILAIRGLKEKGLSLREICSILSIMGIPTKCNGKKWHPQMVIRILTELDV